NRKEKKAGVARVCHDVAEHRAGRDEVAIDTRSIEQPYRERPLEIGAHDIIPDQNFVRGFDLPVAGPRLDRPPGARLIVRLPGLGQGRAHVPGPLEDVELTPEAPVLRASVDR